MSERFYIDLEDSSGNRLGSGPITSAAGWRYTARMDRAGEFRFTMAATDAQAALVTKKRIVRAWALVGGVWTDVGAGVVDRVVRRPQRDGAVLLEVAGSDLLRELQYRSVRDLRLYIGGNPVSHAAALSAVAGYAPAGWTFTPDPAPPVADIYGRFNGESVLAAVIKIANKTRSHFYRGTGRSLVYANTFAPSGVRAIAAGPGDLAAETCAITRLQETRDSFEQITRIYPRGSGNGDVQLTLKATTRTAPAGYTLNKAQNYIQDDAAVAQYGVLEEFVEWREIAPVENTASDIRAAANQLFDEALGELARRSLGADILSYDLTLAGCATLLRPMQSLRVVYRDVVSGLDIDRALNILEATWEVGPDGVQTTGVVVTTADRWPRGESGAVADSLTQGRVYQALPQLSANEYVQSYTKNVDADNSAVFRFRFSRAVTALRWAYFEFQLLPFESTVKSVTGETVTSSAGGGASGSSAAEGTHSHTVTVPSHQHTVTVPAHQHTVTVPAHAHTVTVPGHNHTVSISSHTHTVSVSSHGHGINVYNGTINAAWHDLYLDGGNTILAVPRGGSGVYQVPTTNSGGSSTPTTASGGGQTPTSSTTTDASSSSSTSSQATSSSSQQAQVVSASSSGGSSTPTSSSGGSHQHTVTIPSHTHTVTPVITAVYGIFRESAAQTYTFDDLEYRVNSGAWAPAASAVALGDGWYRLDITPAIQDADTLLPVQASNTVEMRAPIRAISQISPFPLDSVVWMTVEACPEVSVGDRVLVEGTASYNGALTVQAIDTVSAAPKYALKFVMYAGAPGESTGTITLYKTAAIDAQLSIHTTIQPIYQ